MISIKSEKDLEKMRAACRITALALQAAGKVVEPGITTSEIDAVVRRVIEGSGAKPSFLGYNGFPASACISINEQVIHGIPGKRAVKDGDIVSIDVGAYYEGFHGDSANTFGAGNISEQARALIEATRGSFFAGLKHVREGERITDISHAVQQYAESKGFSLVRAYTGHGVGSELHEAPEVPNFGPPGHGARLVRGMTIAIEPMVNAGTFEIKVLGDGWTVITADKKLSAHYEHTVLVTSGEPILLTGLE